MSLRARLNAKTETKITDTAANLEMPDEYLELKEKTRSLFKEKMNANVDLQNENETELKKIVRKILNEEIKSEFQSLKISRDDKNNLINDIIEDEKGFGPLSPLLDNPVITSILVNGIDNVYAEVNGKRSKTDIRFKNKEQLITIIQRIVAETGEKLDETSPLVDVKLDDGTHINAVIPPIAVDNPYILIRKYKINTDNIDGLIERKTLSEEMADVLEKAISAKLNILVSGSSNSGKTTILNCLAVIIPNNERIFTIENSTELSLTQEQVLRFKVSDSQNEINMQELLINALKMSPDRIILDECQGGEAYNIFQAANSGSNGILTSISANTPQDAILRFKDFASYANGSLSEDAIYSHIAAAFDIIIQTERLYDGSYKITSVSEINNDSDNMFSIQDIFRYTLDENNIALHKSTGIVPKFLQKINHNENVISEEIFSTDCKHHYFDNSEAESFSNADSFVQNLAISTAEKEVSMGNLHKMNPDCSLLKRTKQENLNLD